MTALFPIKSSSIKQLSYIPQAEPSLSIPLEIRKSRRKTWSISLSPDLTLLMKIPNMLSFSQAEKILSTREAWILKKYHALEAARASVVKQDLSPSQRQALEKRYRQAAKEYFPARAAYYAELLGVTYATITIRDQKTRWGSCSAKGNLNFNWRLMLAPPRVLDYVVVHELCHRIEMNHSKAFWNTVEMILPDYKEQKKWLRDNGSTLYL